EGHAEELRLDFHGEDVGGNSVACSELREEGNRRRNAVTTPHRWGEHLRTQRDVRLDQELTGLEVHAREIQIDAVQPSRLHFDGLCSVGEREILSSLKKDRPAQFRLAAPNGWRILPGEPDKPILGLADGAFQLAELTRRVEDE